MAKKYLDQLEHLIGELDLAAEVAGSLDARHFFSGAALYLDGTMCASLSPVGLAFKLPAAEVDKLIESGTAKPLKYFPRGHVKKGYALFEDSDLNDPERWRNYFVMIAQQTQRCR